MGARLPRLIALLLVGSLASPARALTVEDAQAILQIEAQRLPPLALADFVTHEDPATRARAARALARLRTVAATAPLRGLIQDDDAEVRAEAAFALGYTQGTGDLVLEALATEADPLVRRRLVQALGRQGEASAVPALVDALGEKPPALQRPAVADAAAIALGRMSMRGVEEAHGDAAWGALALQLRRFDRQTRRGAAFSLARAGRPDPLPGPRDTVLAAARDDGDPVTRAFLVRAVAALEGVDAERDAVLAHAMGDAAPGVRVAAARGAARVGFPGVVALLDDPHPGVRLEAIAALARVDALDHDALLRHVLEEGDTIEAAEVQRLTGDTAVLEAAAALSTLHAAGDVVEVAPWLELARPTELRVAATELLDTPDQLVALATEDAEAPVRTTAAYRLAQLEPTTAQVLPLLGAFDDMVATIAAEHLAEHPDAAAEAALIDAMLDADEPDLLRAGAQALVALYGGDTPLVRGRDRSDRAAAAAEAALASPEGQAHIAGLALAVLLDLSPPPPQHRLIGVDLEEVGRVTQARIETDRGTVILRLRPDEAPVTVHNFARLADDGWFDGLRVHRVVPDFVVQDGDPRGDGMGGPGWSIPDEPNPLPYREGTLGMALAGPDTGGSQWFITLSPQPHLDGDYTVFGEVIGGMHAVHAIQRGDRIDRVVIERRPATEPAAEVSGDHVGVDGDEEG